MTRPSLTAELLQHLASCLLVVLANSWCLWPCSMEAFQSVKFPLSQKITVQISVVADVQPFVAPNMFYADTQVEAVSQRYSRTLPYQHLDLLAQCLYKIMTYFLARGVHNPNDRMLGVLEVSWWGILILLSVSLHGFRGLIGQMIASLRGAERASQLSPEREHWTTLCQANSPSAGTESMSELG